MNKKTFATLSILLIVVIALIAGGFWYYEAHYASSATSTQTQSTTPTQSITLQEAYLNTSYNANLGGATDTAETATTSGQLPPGLSVQPVPLPCPMTPSGTAACGGFKLDGTPTQSGNYSFSVIFATAASQSTQSFNIMVSGAAASSTVSYTNNEYGFTVTLPADWQGYTIVNSTWTGYGGNTTTTLHGPIISIRNPLWTSSTPTQDIPIMVFTLDEWGAVSSGTMPVSAAPIPPSELGENAHYVFALPVRYNYAYPQGWQEVQDILQNDPLHAF